MITIRSTYSKGYVELDVDLVSDDQLEISIDDQMSVCSDYRDHTAGIDFGSSSILLTKEQATVLRDVLTRFIQGDRPHSSKMKHVLEAVEKGEIRLNIGNGAIGCSELHSLGDEDHRCDLCFNWKCQCTCIYDGGIRV